MMTIGKELITEENTMADSIDNKLKLGYYCEDDDYKLYGPFKTVKDCERYNYVNIWQLVKTADKLSRINHITVDFSTNTLTIEGGKNCNIKILDKDIGNGVHSFLPESWELILAKARESCTDVEIIGNPPIEGECLDEMLYLW